MAEATDATRRDKALDRARDHFDTGAFKADLARRVAIPTESQEPAMRPELRRYLDDEIAPWLAERGFGSKVFDNPDPSGGPFLIAERHEGAGLPTLLTYGHGDVVRGIPEQWRSGIEPWTLIEDGQRWYGRGTADNKGQHSIVMAALASVLEERGSLGFNAKILVETGEEIGSPGLDAFVAAQKDALASEIFLASDGPRVRTDAASVMLGNRGGISFDLVVSLREGSRHSGHWGGILEDPGLILAHALASIADKRGRILVKDWLPASIPPRIREAMKGLEVDTAGDAEPLPADWGEPGLSQAEKMFSWTGFIILAFITGRPENPVNGVQPDAVARCQIRFSADVDEADLVPALRRHLDAQGFGMVEIRPSGHVGFPAWRTDPDNPWVDWTLASTRRTLGHDAVLVPNSSGGLPSAIFARHLDVPVIWVPHSYSGCCQHGPNEHLLTPQTREGLELMTGLFWDMGDDTPAS
ncbi:M20 family metallopeptidase [Marinivivus vitaminiproducens]|uniref:M20 family metallopeptidase n=1 Tax=Marinivivus vitaminiproducens TaxID=3035935 RepID=UPI0027A6C77C|nr:M20 family metallopeptidase [Geminicoccaceae bacterium SCSIO 64248]